MKIKLEDFQKAFEVVNHVTASPVADSSQFVRIKRDTNEMTLSLTGMLYAEAHVKCENGGRWTVFVDRRALKAFLSTSKSPDIEFFYKDKLILKTDQRLEVAPHAQVSGYETWNPKSLFDLELDQAKALKTATRYLPHMAGSDHVDAICFRKDYGLIVTDTLYMMGILGTAVKSDFLIPGLLASVLAGNIGKIALDKLGVGVEINGGFVFQPLTSDLDKYPIQKCKSTLEEGVKAPVSFKTKASDLVDVLSAASQFLIEKSDSAEIASVNDGLLLTVTMGSGKFQRKIPTVLNKPLAPVKWALRRLLPWLEFAGDVELEYSKMNGASAFRFTDKKITNLLLFADS